MIFHRSIRSVLPWLLVFFAGPVSASEALFSYKGKEIRLKDLPVGDQLALYEIDLERYNQYDAKIEELILKHHFATLAKDRGQNLSEVEAKELAVTEPSDDEASSWFQANKARLPPQLSLEQVKGDIKAHLKQERVSSKKSELLATLKNKGYGKSLLSAPKAPEVAIRTEGHPIKGSPKAPLTLVEFADFQCPHCKVAGETIDKVLKKFHGKLNLVFLHFPINPSGVSQVVAEGAVCADEQGRYWDYHERAFAQQAELTKDSPLQLAKELKLDEAKFQSCLNSTRPKDRVAQDKSEAERLGLTGTPSLFLRGAKLRSYQEKDLIKAIEEALPRS